MKCPKHNVTLKASHNAETFGWYCEECNGCFLTQKEIKAFKYNYKTDVLEYLSFITPKGASKRSCPACHTTMLEKQLGHVALEACPNCGGVWFDRFEVSRIIEECGEKSWLMEFSNAMISDDH